MGVEFAPVEVAPGYWQKLFSSDQQPDEHAVRQHGMKLVQTVHHHAVRDEWREIEACALEFAKGRELCADEPLLTPYQFCEMRIALTIADCHANDSRVAEAYRQVEKVFWLLEDGDRRRDRLGMVLRPNSTIRANALRILGSAKWEGPDELRGEVMTPEEIVAAFPPVADRALNYLEHHPLSDERNIIDMLGLCEIEICKMVLRCMPCEVPAAVAQFNGRHGLHLTPAPGHFRDHPEASPRSAYYWDFELAKLYLAGECTVRDVAVCTEMRTASCRSTFGDWPLDGLQHKWRAQSLKMLAAIRAGNPGA